jgi:high-affinity iron transporter
MAGVAVGGLAVALVGFLVFRLQVNLPQKKMLIVTGVLIGGVLLMMVGTTTHVLQVIGWLPIHTIGWLPLPVWAGMWLGLYATWEGIGLQVLAAVFVIGSYFLAETAKARDRAEHGRAVPVRT